MGTFDLSVIAQFLSMFNNPLVDEYVYRAICLMWFGSSPTSNKILVDFLLKQRNEKLLSFSEAFLKLVGSNYEIKKVLDFLGILQFSPVKDNRKQKKNFRFNTGPAIFEPKLKIIAKKFAFKAKFYKFLTQSGNLSVLRFVESFFFLINASDINFSKIKDLFHILGLKFKLKRSLPVKILASANKKGPKLKIYWYPAVV